MPLDQETEDLLTFADDLSVEPSIHAPMDRETEDLLAFAESFEPEPLGPTEAQRAQIQAAGTEEAKMGAARRELAGSVLPSWRAYGVVAGAPIVAMAARAVGKGEYADEAIRAAARIEQAQREREKGGIVPDVLQSGLRGAGASLTTMVPAAAIAGPYGAIVAASLQETNSAITAGKDAGKKGFDLAQYAVTQGIVEGVPAAFMQRIGLGGIESAVSKRAISSGIKESLKRLGMTFAQEWPEEIVTELGHNIASWFYDVDPNAMTAESLKQGALETTVQTFLGVGLAKSPDIANAIVTGRATRVTEEIKAYAREGKVPSRKTWRKWRLAPEVGGSRNQRKAYIRELATQLEEPTGPPAEVEPGAVAPRIAPGAPEGAVPAPTATAGVPGVAPGIETGLRPEIVTGPPGAPMEAELNPWEAPPEVLDDMIAAEKATETRIEEELFGKDDAKKYRIAQSTSNNPLADRKKRADADRLIEQMEGGLTESQKNRLFGIGEAGLDVETLKEFRKATLNIDAGSEASLGESVADKLVDLAGNIEKGITTTEEMDLSGQLAVARINQAMRLAQENNYDWENVWKAALRRSVDVIRPENVELLEPFLRGQVEAAAPRAPLALGAPEVAVEAEIIPGPPVRPEVLEGLEPPANETEAVGLSKAEGAEIRRIMGHEQLPEGKARSAADVMEKVAVGRGDEKALDTAQQVIRNPRMLEPYEHVSMVLKARKLLKDLKAARVEQSRAGEAGDEGAFRKATADREVFSQQLAILTEGAQYSGTEVSEAFSIRKLRLSLESYDIVDVMQEIQAVKKPGVEISKKVRDSVTSLTDEHSDLIGKIDERKEELRILDEKKEAALAEKVLAAHKPRKKIGKGIRERSVARQNEFKERIRQMGHRVNDITGVSVEGTYLIGRVGIEYIVQGAGTLIEVAERLRADFPGLTITDHDVNQALIMRSPKEKTRVRSEATKRKTRLLSMARMHVEIENLSRGIVTAAKKKAAVPEDMKKLQKLLRKARNDYYYSDMEAVKIERAVDKLNLLQSQLDNDIKRAKKDPRNVSPELEKINEKIRQVTKEMTLKEKLAEVDEQLRTGKVIVPPKRVPKPIDPELERLQIQLEQRRSEIRQLIADQSPWTMGKIADEVLESLRTLMATGEVSFTLRQNFLQSFSHPVKATERFAKSIKPIFSRDSATQINNRLKDSPNAPIYDLTKLAIMDSESPDVAKRSEVFRANLIEKVPVLGSVIRASARHGVAYSNMMRTGGMDAFVGMWPNATRAELNAWADFQNTSSGLGSLWVFAQAAGVVRRVFFAAKFAASRPQTPYRMFQYWNMPRVRNAIAKDMVRAVATGMGFMSLCALGGAELADWDDVDNADWGKIRIGNTRFDIWGSYLQPARLIARILKGGAARVGLVEPGYGAIDPLDLFGRFAAFKVSPPVSIVRELWTGKTAVGGKTTLVGTVARHTIMMFLQDVYDAAREYNSIPAGAGVGFVAGTGIGAATYKDSESATRQKAARLWAKGESGKANLLVREWNIQPENRDNQIVTFKKTPKK